jgi:hypothetical protein
MATCTRTLALALALALSLAGAACESDGSGNGSGGGGGADTAGGADPGGGGLDCENGVCVLTGTLTEDLTLTPDRQWLLRGGVFVGDDVNETVLTIEPGTTVYGETATQGMLVVRRGSKLMAEGTRAAPIVFTSSKAPGTRSRGDWGGVIVNGRATINACAEGGGAVCEAYGEGGTGWYGGADDADSSGVIRYVRIEFAGRLVSPDNELNGLALQGAGSGTTIEYVQIHLGKDDGIEFFGGTANFKRVLVTGAADDNLDWTDGWRGKGQFFVSVQFEDAGDNGIEADNNAEDNAAAPRSRPVLSNLTLVGVPTSEFSDLGILLREGTGAHIANAIVVGWNEACLDIDHAETFASAHDGTALTGALVLTNSILSCATPFLVDDGEPWEPGTFFRDWNEGNRVVDPQLADPWNPTQPDVRPGTGSPAAGMTPVIPDDPFFEAVDFIGGVDADDDWTAGWTTFVRN